MGDVKVQVVVLVEVGVVIMMTITLTQCQEYTAMTRREWSIIVAVDPLVAEVMKEGTTRNIMTNDDILPKRRRRGLRRSTVVVVQATQEEEEVVGNPTHPKMIPLVTSVVVRVP